MSWSKVLLSCVLSGAMFPSIAGEIRLQNPVPYAEGGIIANNVRIECPLGRQLAEFVQQYSARTGVTITLTDEAPDPAVGSVLKLEIVDARSGGNAFIGHHKSTTVRGALFDNGVQKAGFVARRNSGGGFGAGFKGSCSVLGRTVKALGSDIATWLAAPRDGAQLGDL